MEFLISVTTAHSMPQVTVTAMEVVTLTIPVLAATMESIPIRTERQISAIPAHSTRTMMQMVTESVEMSIPVRWILSMTPMEMASVILLMPARVPMIPSIVMQTASPMGVTWLRGPQIAMAMVSPIVATSLPEPVPIVMATRFPMTVTLPLGLQIPTGIRFLMNAKKHSSREVIPTETDSLTLRMRYGDSGTSSREPASIAWMQAMVTTMA
jgi:hypothetical protein